MTLDRSIADDIRARLGRFGVWRSSRILDPSLGRELESLGFSSLWIGGAAVDLSLAERVLELTSTLVVATGIVSIWSGTPEELAASYHRVIAKYPDRFVLGVGVGHPERVPAAAQPYGAMVDYLDRLDRASVPTGARMIAALGPRMMRLARDRSAGAHPYLVTPEHTRESRELLGDIPVLAPEQRVVLRADPAEARAIGRPSVQNPYLGLVNYRNSLRRIGFTESELDDGGSDRLIDALVTWGDDATVARRLGEHLAAGADHVAVQLVSAAGEEIVPAYARIARALGLTESR